MKRIAGIVLLSAVLPALAATPDVSGKWKLQSEFTEAESESVCTLKQDGDKLTGSCDRADAVMTDLTGVVTETEVRWSVKTVYDGNPLTVTYQAKLTDPTTMKGSIDVQPMSMQGTFTAKKL